MRRTARVLAVVNPAEGHLYPMVPFLWALRAAGADMLVACADDFRPAVTGSGLPAVGICPGFDMVEAMRPDVGAVDAPTQPPGASAARAGTGAGFARLTVRQHQGLLGLARSWKPDLLIGETSAASAVTVGSEIDVPVVEFQWGLPLHPEVKSSCLRELTSAGMRTADPHLTLGVSPTAFRTTADVPPDVTVRYVPYNGPAQIEPGMLTPAVHSTVVVTLGTVLPRYGSVAPLLVPMVQELEKAGMNCVVAMRPQDRDRISADGLPTSIRRSGWMPLETSIRRACVVVHHGGSGSTLTALAVGRPQVVIPHFADQFSNAEHVVAAGCGAMAGATSTPRGLAEQVRASADDKRIVSAAHDLSLRNAREPSPAEAAERVLSLIT